jgi:hypothetical protein
MKITTKLVTSNGSPYAFFELQPTRSQQHMDLNIWNPESSFTFFKPSPDELETAAKALLELAHALRTELAAYEARKAEQEGSASCPT